MKYNANQPIYLFLKSLAFFLILILTHCSAKGPVLTKLENQSPALLTGSYRFSPNIRLFKNSQLGKLTFKKIRKRGVKKHFRTAFSLKILGQLKNGSVRIRSYHGNAIITNGILELQSTRCYLFGKKYWEDKLKAMLRFDCDHLVFQFQSPSNFQNRDILKQMHSQRTRFSDWFKLGEMHPLPALHFKSIFFAGQVLEFKNTLTQDFKIKTKNGEKEAPLDNHIQSKIKNTDFIVWGANAAILLRDKQELFALDAKGRRAGILEIISRPGNTILCRWKKRSQYKPFVVYTTKDARTGESLF